MLRTAITEVSYMSNTKRAILFLLLAVGLIILLIGATTSAYSAMTGVLSFFIFLFSSFALGRSWALKRYKAQQDLDTAL